MLPKRILIIGGEGQIGGALFDVLKKHSPRASKLALGELWRIYGADRVRGIRARHACDITNRSHVHALIKKISPDVVILTAAFVNVDACETQKFVARKVNFDGVKHVTDACKAQRAKLIFFSSAYVFDGKKGDYREKDVPRPINYYGKTKVWAEQYVQKELADHLIIRTTWVFDWGLDEKNFLVQVVRNARAGQSMNVPKDQWGNPTLARNIADVVAEMIKQNTKGMWHIAGREHMNKYEWAVRIVRHFGLAESCIVPVYTKDLAQRALRPLKADLNIGKAQKTFHTSLLSLQEALAYIQQENSTP